jgi:hypothetical protein
LSQTLPLVGAAELALRVQLLPAVSTYVVLLAPTDAVAALVEEIVAEVQTLDGDDATRALAPCAHAARLLHQLKTNAPGVLVVDAGTFVETDWRLLDRRRSDLAREGVTVFVTIPESFDTLMRVAPNLASWMGGQVFAWDPSAGVTSDAQKEQRLASLRTWGAPLTDAKVIAAAEEGTLGRDPEFGEWLVLLGRGDLVR